MVYARFLSFLSVQKWYSAELTHQLFFPFYFNPSSFVSIVSLELNFGLTPSNFSSVGYPVLGASLGKSVSTVQMDLTASALQTFLQALALTHQQSKQSLFRMPFPTCSAIQWLFSSSLLGSTRCPVPSAPE